MTGCLGCTCPCERQLIWQSGRRSRPAESRSGSQSCGPCRKPRHRIAPLEVRIQAQSTSMWLSNRQRQGARMKLKRAWPSLSSHVLCRSSALNSGGRDGTRACPPPSRSRCRRMPGSHLDSEQFNRITAGQPLAFLVRQPLEATFHNVARVGERHVEMRVVVRPHAVLFSPPGQRPGADVILQERTVYVLSKNLAW